jgi:hypothetical protein
MKHSAHSCNCNCCAAMARMNLPGVSRRSFLYSVGAAAAGSLVLPAWAAKESESGYAPQRRPRARQAIIVQPVLTYDVPTRREATSWRNWGGIQTDQAAQAEKVRLEEELKKISSGADSRWR